MQPNTAGTLPLATLLMPILALIVISAVDSVKEDDSVLYRLFVAGFGIAALGPIGVVVVLGILSTITNVQPGSVVFYALLSVGLILVLIIVTTVKETMRGIEESDKKRYVAGLVLVIIWYVLLFYFP